MKLMCFERLLLDFLAWKENIFSEFLAISKLIN